MAPGWLLQKKKKKKIRVPKKSGLNSLLVLKLVDKNNSKKPSVLDKADQSSNGPSTSSVEGKRKAHSGPVFSLTSQAFNVEASPNESTRSDLGHGNYSPRLPKPVGKFHKGTSKTKPFATSVKGKKYYARARASSLSPSLATTSEGISSFKLDWSSNIFKLQSVPSGEFKFCSLARNEVGDQCRWTNSGNFKDNHRRDQSPTYPLHGMVQLQATQRMVQLR